MQYALRVYHLPWTYFPQLISHNRGASCLPLVCLPITPPLPTFGAPTPLLPTPHETGCHFHPKCFANSNYAVEDQSSPTADDSHHAGQGDDQMFGDDSDNDEKLSVHDSGEESEVGSRKRKRTTNGSMMEADRDEGKGIGGGGDGDTDEDGDGVKEEEILDELDEELFGDEEEESGDGKKLQYVTAFFPFSMCSFVNTICWFFYPLTVPTES